MAPMCESCNHRHHAHLTCEVCGHSGKGKAYMLVAKTTAPSSASLHFEAVDQRQEANAFKSHWALARIIRNRVFVEEGRIAEELEFDAHDPTARHVLGRLGDAPVLCARWRLEHPGTDGNGNAASVEQQQQQQGTVAVIDRLAVLGPYRTRGFSTKALEFLLQDIHTTAQEMQAQGCLISTVALTLPLDLAPFLGDKLRVRGQFEVEGGPYMSERGLTVIRLVRPVA